MSLPPESAYPYLSPAISQDELEACFTPTVEEQLLAERYCRGVCSRVCFLTLLKATRRLRRFIPLEKVPRRIGTHLAQWAGVDPKEVDWEAYDRGGSRRRHVALIRDVLGLKPFDAEGRSVVEAAFREVARTREEMEDFIDAGVDP